MIGDFPKFVPSDIAKALFGLGYSWHNDIRVMVARGMNWKEWRLLLFYSREDDPQRDLWETIQENK